MLIGVLLGLALLVGIPWQLVAVAALAVWHPIWFLAGAGAWAVANRRRRAGGTADDEAAFLRGLAAELAAGASLRSGVVAAASRAPALDLRRAVRHCLAGSPAGPIGTALRQALPVNGVAAAATFRLAARTGGSIAPVVEVLAERAAAEGHLVRERAALTSQARLSAWLVGGAPVGLVVAGGLAGFGPDASELGTAGLLLTGAGLALIGAGSLVVWAMLRRAAR